MKHISIFGTCCLRDIFGLAKEKGNYEIDAFVQNVNPLSAVMASPLSKEADERFDKIFGHQSRFYRRCARQDVDKSILDYFEENHSDWLLMDFAELRWDLFSSEKGGGTYRHPEEIQQLKDEGYLDEFRVVPTASLGLDKIYTGIDLLMARILRLYPEDHIILVDVRGVERMVNRDTERSAYFEKDAVNKINPLAQQVYTYVSSRYKACHCIPFPEDTPADHNHKWGREPLHYVQEYYDYALEAVNLITDGAGTREEERSKITMLKLASNAQIKKTYADYDRNKISFLTKELTTAKRFKSYEQYFKEILVRDKRKTMVRFFTAPDKHIAIWGLNENSKLFLELVGDHKEQISYIVYGSQEGNYQRIQLIPENAAEFPEADCLVISDLACEEIKKRVSAMNRWNTIMTYEDLIR